MTKLYKQVPVLDSGARGATTTFVQKQIGDVHLAWENEAHLEVREAKGELELVYPPISIRAEPHVAVVDANVDRKKTRAAAEAYLKFLYTDEAQEIIAKHFYRPSNEAILKKHAATLPGHPAVRRSRRSPRTSRTRTSSSSPRAACSTRSTSPSRPTTLTVERERRADAMASVNRKVLPGFSLTLGYTVFYLSVLVLLPIAGVLPQGGLALVRRVLGARSGPSARAPPTC